MLDALRRGAQGWLAKILFAILIVSFGVFWNVSGSLRNYGRNSVAQVGDSAITVDQFQRAFQSNLRALQTEGRRITADQAVMFGLDRQALEQVMAQTAVMLHAQKLGLALSDATLVEGVRKDSDFAGPDGKFSSVGFDNLLRQMGMSEQGFLKIRREDELRRQITDAMREAIVAPLPVINDVNAYREETRTIEFVQIDAKKVTVAAPDESKLKETYENNKQRFMTPEYRKLAALFLSTEDLKREVTISDEDLKAHYQETKSTYDKPELRRLQQIAFKTKAEAEAAHKELVQAKKNFMDVAKAHGAKESDVNLGLLPKTKIIDPKVADVAFSLERDKVSDVVEGLFANVIIRAIEIQPGKESTFEEVKDKVRDALQTKRAALLLQDRIDLVEEGRNAGKSLKEIGAEQKLRFVEAEAVDRDNKTPDGKTAIDQPDAAIMLKEAFHTSPGEVHEVVELSSESFAWFDVISVTEAKQKPFDEVKDQVKDVYTELETERLVNEFAQKLADRLKAGEDMAKVAADAGGKPDVLDSIKRNTSPPGLTNDAVKQAFALPKGGAGSAETSDRASRVVFRVKEVVAAEAPSQAQSEKLAAELSRELENEYLLAYVEGLKKDLGATVNLAELRRATGVAQDQ